MVEVSSFRTLLEQVESLSISDEVPVSQLQRFTAALSTIGSECSSVLQELTQKLEKVATEKDRLKLTI
jgi:hypothetical protein